MTAARGRLAGVDVARAVALVGMVGVHVATVPVGAIGAAAQDQQVPAWDVVAGGRASALFAVLAGCGLALATGAGTPRTGPALATARRGVAARAGVLAAVGLTVGAVPTPAAVILAYTGVLLVVALPVLGWGAGRLAAAAAVVAVGAPVLSHLLRAAAPRAAGPNVGWETLLTDPVGLARTLLIDGYYPVLTWTAYLLLGLAVGRLPLAAARTAAGLAAGGLALAGAGLAAGAATLRLAGGADALGRSTGESGPAVLLRLATSSYGVSPTQSWWWLGTAGRHSGTTPDLLHTAGSALAVLGVCLLVAGALRRRRGGRVLLAPLVAVGSTTLTLYTLHVLLLGAGSWVDAVRGAPTGLVVTGHLAVALLVAAAVRAPARRGPLEAIAAGAAREAAARGGQEVARPADS